MVILYSSIMAFYVCFGFIWAVLQTSNFDSDSPFRVIYDSLFIDKFQEGNIFGKILIIIKDIILSPFIILMLIFIVLLTIGSILLELINKLCGWDDE